MKTCIIYGIFLVFGGFIRFAAGDGVPGLTFPTDMPLGGRALYRKDSKMKAYMNQLDGVKVACLHLQPSHLRQLAGFLEGQQPFPKNCALCIFDNVTGTSQSLVLPPVYAEGTTHFADLLVEDERVHVPYNKKGIDQVEKIQLDKDRIGRYLDILAVEEAATRATITLDPNRIREYIRKLQGSTRPTPELVYRSRVKLLKEVPQNFGQRVQDVQLIGSRRHGRAISKVESDVNRDSEEEDEIKEVEIGHDGEVASPVDSYDSDSYFASDDYNEKLRRGNDNDDYVDENYYIGDQRVKDEDLDQNHEISDYKISEDIRGTDYINGANHPDHKIIRTERKVRSNNGSNSNFIDDTKKKEGINSRKHLSGMDLLKGPNLSIQVSLKSPTSVVPSKSSDNSESTELHKINSLQNRLHPENHDHFSLALSGSKHKEIHHDKGNQNKRELAQNYTSADNIVTNDPMNKNQQTNTMVKSVAKSSFSTDYSKNKNQMMSDHLKYDNKELNERTSEKSFIISKNLKNSSDINRNSSVQGTSAESKYFGSFSNTVLPPIVTLEIGQYLNNNIMFNRSRNVSYLQTTETTSRKISIDSIALLNSDNNRSQNTFLIKNNELLFGNNGMSLANSTDSKKNENILNNILGNNSEQVLTQYDLIKKNVGDAMKNNESSNQTASSPYQTLESSLNVNINVYDIPQNNATDDTTNFGATDNPMEDNPEVVTLFEIPQMNNQNEPSQNTNQNASPKLKPETISNQNEMQKENLSDSQRITIGHNESSNKKVDTYSLKNGTHLINVSEPSKSAIIQNNIPKNEDQLILKGSYSQNNSIESLKTPSNLSTSINKDTFDKYNASVKIIIPSLNSSSYQKANMAINLSNAIQQKEIPHKNFSEDIKYEKFSTNSFDYIPVINMNNKSMADQVQNKSLNSGSTNRIKTVTDKSHLKNIYVSSNSKENVQNISLTDEEKKLIQSQGNFSNHILSTVNSLYDAKAIGSSVKVSNSKPHEEVEAKILNEKEHTQFPLNQDQFIPDFGRNMSAQENSTFGFPSIVNTVLDLMASSAKHLLDNPLSDNITSLSIHILGPGIPENIINGSISSFLPIQQSVHYHPNTFVTLSANRSGLSNEFNLTTKSNTSANPNSLLVPLEKMNSISHYYKPLNIKEKIQNSKYLQRKQSDIDMSQYVLPFMNLNESKLFNNRLYTDLESGRMIFSNFDHKGNEINHNIFGNRFETNASPELLNRNLQNSNFYLLPKPTMNNFYHNKIQKSLEDHNLGGSPEFYNNLYKYLNNTNMDEGFIFKIVGKALDDIGRSYRKDESTPKWLKDKYKFFDIHQVIKTPLKPADELNFSTENNLKQDLLNCSKRNFRQTNFQKIHTYNTSEENQPFKQNANTLLP